MIEETDFYTLFVTHFRIQVFFMEEQERDAALSFLSFQKPQDAMHY